MDKSHFVAAGAPASTLDKLEAASVPWTQLLAWLVQYGPKVFAAIDQVLSTIAPGTPLATIIAEIDKLLQAGTP